MRKAIVMAMTALLVLALAVPVAAGGAEHTDFYGAYYPAGLGSPEECPHTLVPLGLGFCVIDPGNQDVLPSGRLRIRNMKILELAFAWNEDGPEPRKSGYDVVLANANLDANGNGPTWGTWNLYRDSNYQDLMFSGTFTGKFENWIPAVHFTGRGTGSYEGQKMRGDIGRELNAAGFNMFGTIIEK